MTTFFGTDVVDIVAPGDGYAILYGAGGGDELAPAGAGYAYVEGGLGGDYLWTQTLGDVAREFYGGFGNDRIETTSSRHGERAYGGSGDDYLRSYLGTIGVVFEGGLGRDSLQGGAGGDVLLGGEGNDSGSQITVGEGMSWQTKANPGLFGGDGEDYLDGGRGKDLLVAGDGRDVVVGGLGRDVFDYDSALEAKGDHIMDFESKRDKIDLSGIDAKAGGGDNAFRYIESRPFSGHKGDLHLRLEYLAGDINGDGKADFRIHLLNVAELHKGDLIL